MFRFKYDFAGLSSDDAISRIARMDSLENQAEALIEHSHLTRIRRGAALMKKIAAPTTPCRRHLFEVLQAQQAEKARKKAVSDRKKAEAAARAAYKPRPSLFPEFQ